jgi:hypothetical protein
MVEEKDDGSLGLPRFNEDPYNSLRGQSADIVTSHVHILEKHAEPETQIDKKSINRNNVLGNISKEELPILANTRHVQRIVEKMPIEVSGGTNGLVVFAELLNDDIHFMLVTSNSVDGKARTLSYTKITQSQYKDATKKSTIDGLFGRKGSDN